MELLRTDLPRGGFRAVLFDFDGTLSLIRRGWPDVMIPMMVDILAATPRAEPREQLASLVEEFVMRLNGKQTIFQMIQLADEVRARGGEPQPPLTYKQRYHELLWGRIEHRVTGLRLGHLAPAEWTVPGSHALLRALAERDLPLYLASGTDVAYVRDEAAVLAVDPFFGGRIYGALDNYRDFSKSLIIEQIIRETGVGPGQLLAFGDGFVEIEETRKAGGVAVGVASEEQSREGINLWKRQRLIRAGADIIIGDYSRLDEILAVLGL